MVLNSLGLVLNLLHERNIFHLFNCMSIGGEKVVSILDIHLPELELEKPYFCRTRTR